MNPGVFLLWSLLAFQWLKIVWSLWNRKTSWVHPSIATKGHFKVFYSDKTNSFVRFHAKSQISGNPFWLHSHYRKCIFVQPTILATIPNQSHWGHIDCGFFARNVFGHFCGHGILGIKELHPPRFGGSQLSRWWWKCGEDLRFWHVKRGRGIYCLWRSQTGKSIHWLTGGKVHSTSKVVLVSTHT